MLINGAFGGEHRLGSVDRDIQEDVACADDDDVRRESESDQEVVASMVRRASTERFEKMWDVLWCGHGKCGSCVRGLIA